MCIIYRLDCPDGFFYIGSTKQSLEQRFYSHKRDSKKYNRKLYTHINSIGWDSIKIIILEECDDTIRQQREDELIKASLLDTKCLNHNRVSITVNEKIEYQRQYYVSRKEEKRQYQSAHKEEIIEYQKQYHSAHKEEIVEYQRQYYSAHKEKIVEYQKQYQSARKEKLAEQRRLEN